MTSFTFQTIALASAFASDLLTRSRALRLFSDDLVSAIFSFANMVSVAFLVTSYFVKDSFEEPHIKRPFLLSEITHVFNAVVAWADLLLAPRAFTARARTINATASLAFIFWINLCAHFNGRYPYPFLERLPFPQGIIGVACACLLINLGFFYVGKGVASLLRGPSEVPSEVEQEKKAELEAAVSSKKAL